MRRGVRAGRRDPTFFSLLNVLGERYIDTRTTCGFGWAIKAALYHMTLQSEEKIKKMIDAWGHADAICHELGKPREAGFSPALVAMAERSAAAKLVADTLRVKARK